MLELTRQEAMKLRLTLNWVLDATLGGEEDRAIVKSISDKVSNILKSDPRRQRITLILSKEDETN